MFIYSQPLSVLNQKSGSVSFFWPALPDIFLSLHFLPILLLCYTFKFMQSRRISALICPLIHISRTSFRKQINVTHPLKGSLASLSETFQDQIPDVVINADVHRTHAGEPYSKGTFYCIHSWKAAAQEESLWQICFDQVILNAVPLKLSLPTCQVFFCRL